MIRNIIFLLGWTADRQRCKITLMAAVTHLMTVEEFRKLPADQGPVYHELRHGAVGSRNEGQTQSVEVEWPAPEAVTVKPDFHPVSPGSSSDQ